MNDTKFCVNCKWSVAFPNLEENLEIRICQNPTVFEADSRTNYHRLVSGIGPEKSAPYCSVARLGTCGTEAKYFEAL